MPRSIWIAGALASAITVGAVLAQVSFGQDVSQPSNDPVRSAALYTQLAPVLLHPRCMNCHTSTDFPRQGDDGHPHIMHVKRGPEDRGVAALQCSTCHQKTNSPAGIPGNETWHLAPLSMAWEGLSAGEICRSLTDPERGGMTAEQLIAHLGTDRLVMWAWAPGVDLNGDPRQAPPISHAEFAELVRQWVAGGAACPD